jgi:GT2 family glycosyltransferase
MTFRSPIHHEAANDSSEPDLGRITRVQSPHKISFIIPVFNGLELTKACLDSLTTTVDDYDHEIIVVDDGSTDGTRAFLSSIERPDVHVVLNDQNLGYARANNAGAIRASGEFLCLANNDLVFTSGWLAPLMIAFESYPDAGIVGNIQKVVATGAIDHAGIKIGLDGKPHHIRRLSLVRRLRRFSTVPAVTGACMMVRREDFLAAGGFDEQFVNGAEDVDLCFQMHEKGKRRQSKRRRKRP